MAGRPQAIVTFNALVAAVLFRPSRQRNPDRNRSPTAVDTVNEESQLSQGSSIPECVKPAVQQARFAGLQGDQVRAPVPDASMASDKRNLDLVCVVHPWRPVRDVKILFAGVRDFCAYRQP
jgi:hypothetical protein